MMLSFLESAVDVLLNSKIAAASASALSRNILFDSTRQNKPTFEFVKRLNSDYRPFGFIQHVMQICRPGIPLTLKDTVIKPKKEFFHQSVTAKFGSTPVAWPSGNLGT